MKLDGKTVYGSKGDMDVECTIKSGQLGVQPFVALDTQTGMPVERFTKNEAKLLQEGNLPGWELA